MVSLRPLDADPSTSWPEQFDLPAKQEAAVSGVILVPAPPSDVDDRKAVVSTVVERELNTRKYASREN